MNNYTNLVRAYIYRRGITQKEFSLRTGISRTKISIVMLGREKFTEAHEKIIDAFLESERCIENKSKNEEKS